MIIDYGINNGLVVGIMSENIFTVHEDSEDKEEFTAEDVTETTCVSLYLGIFRVTFIFD